MSAAKKSTKLVRLPALAAIWEGLQGPGKSVVETPEQRAVRRWLQGKDL